MTDHLSMVGTGKGREKKFLVQIVNRTISGLCEQRTGQPCDESDEVKERSHVVHDENHRP